MGCMSTHPMDRSFIVQPFRNTENGEKVIVIGAHFPHGTDFYRLSDVIESVMKSTGVSSVILIADTNQKSYSSIDIMEKLKIPHAKSSRSTHLLKSCCLSKPGFKYPFDRIITNTPGTAVRTAMLLEWLPLWVVGELHKPILGTFTFHGSKSSVTAGAAETSTMNSSSAPTDTPSV